MKNSETRSFGGKGRLHSLGLEGVSLSQKQLNDHVSLATSYWKTRASLTVDFPNLSQNHNLASKTKQTKPKCRAPSESRSRHSRHPPVI